MHICVCVYAYAYICIYVFLKQIDMKPATTLFIMTATWQEGNSFEAERSWCKLKVDKHRRRDFGVCLQKVAVEAQNAFFKKSS